MDNNLYFSIKNIKNWTGYIDKFWELHPSATRMGSLSSLYENDKSKKKYVSSRKAWFCVLYCHPESDFYNLEHEDKIKDLAGDLLPIDTRIEKMYESLLPCIKYIEKAVTTPSVKHLIVLHKKLKERDDLYEATPYTLANSELLDKMIKSSSIMFKIIQECEDIIKESNKDGSVKGGGELSLSESGSLFD